MACARASEGRHEGNENAGYVCLLDWCHVIREGGETKRLVGKGKQAETGSWTLGEERAVAEEEKKEQKRESKATT